MTVAGMTPAPLLGAQEEKAGKRKSPSPKGHTGKRKSIPPPPPSPPPPPPQPPKSPSMKEEPLQTDNTKIKKSSSLDKLKEEISMVHVYT